MPLPNANDNRVFKILPLRGTSRISVTESQEAVRETPSEDTQQGIDATTELMNSLTQALNTSIPREYSFSPRESMTSRYSSSYANESTYNGYGMGDTNNQKKMKKSTEKSKDSNPYIKSMKSEYLSLLEDINEYKIDINSELLNKISTDIESIERSNENIKRLYNELYTKEDSVNGEIKTIKSSIQTKINQIKFDNLIVKFDEYYNEKNWTNAEKCYINASHYAYTEDMFKVLESKALKMASRKEEIDISNLTDLIKKFLNGSSASSTVLNNIFKRLITVNLTKLEESNRLIIKDFLSSLSTSNKGKALTCVLENKTYSSKLTLNII